MHTPRVLLLHRDLSPQGGVPRVLLTFSRHYDHRRLQLHIGSFQPIAPEMTELFVATGTALHELGDAGYLGPALALRRIIKAQAIDMVVATSLKSFLVAKLAAGSICRVMFWIHAIPLVFSGPVKVMAYRWAARNNTLIFIARTVQRAHGYAGHKGREVVVLNGVDDVLSSDTLYGLDQRETLGIPRPAFVVGYTAEFIAWKQHGTLLDAFSKLAMNFPDLHLVLIGTGELWEKTRDRARELPGAERVHFLGPRPDARKLLGIMDVYTQPSDGEGFGIAVVEAMLARRAMLVSNAGALPEIIEDGSTGLLCRVGDASDLANKIMVLAQNPEMRRSLGEKARQVALERFAPEPFAERLTAVLEGEFAASRTAACDVCR